MIHKKEKLAGSRTTKLALIAALAMGIVFTANAAAQDEGAASGWFHLSAGLGFGLQIGTYGGYNGLGDDDGSPASTYLDIRSAEVGSTFPYYIWLLTSTF